MLKTVLLYTRQRRRKHLKLGRARHFEGTFFLRKRGLFLKIKRALLCLLQNLGGALAPSAPPVRTSMIQGIVYKNLFKNLAGWNLE